MGKAFIDLEQQRLDIGAVRMRALARTGAVKGGLGHGAPLEEREELTVALDDGLMLLHQGQGVLVKDARVWYHGSKLLAGQVGQRFFYSACKRGLCQEWAP